MLIQRLTSLGFAHVRSGKVRETFAVPGFPQLLFIVCTDRISIFDIVLNAFVALKGAVLNAMTIFWIIEVFKDKPTHLVAFGKDMDRFLPKQLHGDRNLYQRSMIVEKMVMLPVEAIIRGRLTGSGWKDYQSNSGVVCGIQLPPGLHDGSALPQNIFTPSTKADMGLHDVNISFEQLVALTDLEKAEWVRSESLELFSRAAEYALPRGIIIADTKMEFAWKKIGDEIITPDSSRFWPADKTEEAIATGKTPPSLDKQPVRDWGKSAGIKDNPTIVPPPEVLQATTGRYLKAFNMLVDMELRDFQEYKMGLTE